ncbi:hypothetical protein JQ615_28215 [Bradyrhizobium jicamae]|uniref:Uncharacterized protein n=1 Tax=Bradyrhizobium jicamae TaxID=280332 RepID=A0ABS5FR31_9BRAD|nr:hypothetical protein [Bradyrhizobium jicamae]MBR0799280.1 hypothetical protein [Bradyrhizobium jicamae]
MQTLLDARKVSASELLEYAVARIELLDSRIIAVEVRDFERARAAAREADVALARGERDRMRSKAKVRFAVAATKRHD